MSDSELNATDTQLKEMEAGRRPGLAAKLKAHVQRFWWLHLIIFIFSTLIIILCM